MSEDLFTPAAIVKQDDVRAELAPKIRAVYRRNKEDRKQMREWLRQCKEECIRRGEDWLPWLAKETGIPPRTAQWIMQDEDENNGQEQSVIRNIAHDPPSESEIVDSVDDSNKEEIPQPATPTASIPPTTTTPTPPPHGDDGASASTPMPHVAHNSGDNEWYTPGIYIDAARRVLGEIDLDPASNPIAQRVVGAMNYYTKEDDGLSKNWSGRVWMNPPYAAGLVDGFIAKLCQHIEDGDVTDAIILVNNATETRWFQQAMRTASALCFPQSRIRFLAPDGELGAPLQGQAFLYFGSDVSSFSGVFGAFGPCLSHVQEGGAS